MNQQAEAKKVFEAVMAGVAGAAKVLCDRGIISIKPRVQPPEALESGNLHYYTGDYVAESILIAANAGFDILVSMAPDSVQ